MIGSKVAHLQRIALEPDLVKTLDALGKLQGISREEMIVQILRDWLTAINALPYHDLDEDTEAAGEA